MNNPHDQNTQDVRRAQLLRMVREVEIATPGPNGIDRDEISKLVNFLATGCVSMFHVIGAVRRSGATKSQLEEILHIAEGKISSGRMLQDAVNEAILELMQAESKYPVPGNESAPNPPLEPIFIVGSSSLFSKTRLTSHEFGIEITRLGFRFGVEQFERYQKTPGAGAGDLRLLTVVGRNPGLMQLLFANLITGAFLCYAKFILKASDKTVSEVEAGVLSELRSTMHGMSEGILENHVDITVNFSIAIERELLEVEENSSRVLFFRYVHDFYPDAGIGTEGTPSGGLPKLISGLGSRFMAICQDNFKLALQ
jgi:hypothetical protein